MHDLPTAEAVTTAPTRPSTAPDRDVALRAGLRKRAAGVPTFSVPEAAALLSVSREHLYRLIRAGVFPAMRMGLGAEHGRYVVPANAVEALLDAAFPPDTVLVIRRPLRRDGTSGDAAPGGIA